MNLTPAQRAALATLDEHGRVHAHPRTLTTLQMIGLVGARVRDESGTWALPTEQGVEVIAELAATAGPADQLAPRRRGRTSARPALVVVDKGDERSPYCNAGARQLITKLGAGWSWRLVHGVGAIPGTAPKPPAEAGADKWGRWAALRGEIVDTKRKTIDVMVPVHSISVRLHHEPTGFRGVACWTWRSDKGAWVDPTFYAWHPVHRPRPAQISAADFAAYVGRDLGEVAA